MAHLNYHPAPGFGDLLPGFFVVPQNPLVGDRTPMVPSVQAAAGGVPVAKGRMGDLLPGRFAVPQNPLLAAMAAGGHTPESGLSGSLSSLGCGGACGCSGAGSGTCGCSGANFYGMSGIGNMGGFTDDAMTWAKTPAVFGLPNWVVFGAGAAVLFMFLAPGGADYRRERSALREKYRGYRRAGRSALAGAKGAAGAFAES